MAGGDSDAGLSDENDSKMIGNVNFNEVDVFFNDDVRVGVASSPIMASVTASTNVEVFLFPHGHLYVDFFNCWPILSCLHGFIHARMRLLILVEHWHVFLCVTCMHV